MSTQSRWILLFLTVCAALGAAWWIATSGEGDERPERSSSLRASEEGATRSAEALRANPAMPRTNDESVTRAESSAKLPDPASDGAAAAWIVRGRAQLPDDAALPNAGIEISLYAGSDARGEPRERATLAADDGGAIAWQLAAAPRDVVTLRLRGQSEGYFSFVSERTVDAGAPPPQDLKVEFYPLDVIVRGFVRNEKGEPLADARVKSMGQEKTSRSDGGYELRTISALGEKFVEAIAPHHASQRQVVQPNGPGAVIDLDFALPLAFKIRGRVLDEAGLAVAGARVTTFFSMGQGAESDAEGRYEVDHLDRKRESHSLYARKEGYCEARAEVKPRGGEPIEQDLVLKRGTRVEGVVLDDREQPLAGVELYIGFSPAAYNRLDARSGENGAFVFPAVDAGSQTLVAQHPRFAPLRKIFEVGAGEKVKTLRLTLQRGHFAAGIVRDDTGAPRAKVRISGRVAGEYIDVRSESDEDGRFRIEGLPAENVSLELYARGIVRLEHPLPVVDRDDLDLTVQRSGRVAGRVVDAETGLGLDDFVIRFVSATLSEGEQSGFGYSATWSREGHRFTKTDGWWDSGDESLPPGKLLGIEARAAGRAIAREGRVRIEVEPDRTQLVLRIPRGGSVAGRVKDAAGDAVAGAKVRWHAEGIEVPHWTEEPFEFGLAITDAQGEFAIELVPPGTSFLSVEVPDRPRFEDGPFEVKAGEQVRREIVVPRGARLRGELRDAGGEPLANELVSLDSLERESGSFSAEARTDGAGAFAFEGLGAGLYQVSHVLEHERIRAHATSVRTRITSDAEKFVVLRPQGGCTLRGTVRAEAELPSVIAISVLATSEGLDPELAPPNRGTLARDGKFEITALPAGRYLLNAFFQSGDGMWHGAQHVDVAAGESPAVTFEMKRLQR